VKRLRIYIMEGPNDVKHDFCQEAVVWKGLAHPNIVPLLGVTVAPFQFVSAWMPGGELSEYIGTHPCVDRIGLALDVANGLSYLHSQSVVHGDLKGPSVLVDDGGHARITDFGFSTVVSDAGSATSITEGHAVRWAAPETLDMVPVSKGSDIYSFAMIMVETFAGKAPFYGILPTTVAVGVLSGNRPARPVHSSLTDDLWDLTKRCWNQDPKLRPEIAEVVLCLQVASKETDDTTLGSVQRQGSPYGVRCRRSRWTPVSCMLGRLCGLGKPIDDGNTLPYEIYRGEKVSGIKVRPHERSKISIRDNAPLLNV